ncbi:MAG: NeuD/PglB/VioB family sugar acetyltransferase [Ilumatobacteraceae bacterium]
MSDAGTTEDIVIVGAGGLGREVLDIVDALGVAGQPVRCLGFLDDGPVRDDLLAPRGIGVLGGVRSGLPADLTAGTRFIIGIGDGAVRRTIDAALTAAGWRPMTLIHPVTSAGFGCNVGDGCIQAAGARITTNVSLGRHTQLHVNVAVGHDAVLEDFVSVLPGATISGNVRLGEGVTVGTGANVLPGITVGAGAFVGAGAVVTRDVAPGVTVVGSPARPLPARG